MLAVAIIVGVLALISTFGVTLFTVGDVPAYVITIAVAAVAIVAAIKLAKFLGRIVLVLTLLLVGTLGYGGWSAYQVIRALADNDGPVDPANAEDLASANAKIDGARGVAGFRVELTEAELTAVLLDALSSNADNPLKSLTLTMVGDEGGGPGRINFVGKFKSGSITAKGSLSAEFEAGRVTFSLKKAELGNFKMPGIARTALDELVGTITDLNDRLEEQGADIQFVEITDGLAIIAGVQGDGELVSLGSILDSVKQNVAGLGTKVTPPAEVLGPGAVNALEASGLTYYVALGDSLAANVGVAAAREGYVSRFHKAVSAKEAAVFGLRNFGRPDETSSGLIRNQLNGAIDFMKDNEIAFVTIDIGANDLLGHLFSPDCSESIETPACQARLVSAKGLYRENLVTILDRVRRAAPNATIIFLGMYNPFSIGFGPAVGLEGATDSVVDEVNAIAAEVAEAEGMKFADGQSVIKGRAGAVTHMLEQPPDIHPRAIGYDLLAQALVAALE